MSPLERSNLDWAGLKNLPRSRPTWRRLCLIFKSHGDKTVDTEFEAWVRQLDVYYDLCGHLKSLTRASNEAFCECLSRAEATSWEYRRIFSESTFDTSTTNQKTVEEENAQRLYYAMKELENNADSTKNSIASVVVSVCKSLQRTICNVRKNVVNRDKDLRRYDCLMNLLDALSLKNVNGVLTPREARRYRLANDKVEVARKKFILSNHQMLVEFPFFFKIADAALEKVILHLYYHKLSLLYAMNTSLLTLHKMFAFDTAAVGSDDFYWLLVQSFPIPDSAPFTITAFRRKHLNKLVASSDPARDTPMENFDPLYEYCISVFPYQSEQEGDLQFDQGTVIKIIEKEGDWWRGETAESSGYFPSNYVVKYTEYISSG